MEKSLATLLVISLELPLFDEKPFAESLLLQALILVRFKLISSKSAFTSVQAKTRPRTGGLKTLWIPSLWNLPTERPTFFKNLGSLKVEDWQSQSAWKEVFSHCHLSLKHLSLELFGTHDDELLQPLQFPILEILKLDESGEVFPCWMVVSSSL